jgi:hypothetical protein
MSIREVIETVNQMEADGIIDRYAIGGAVAATFYLEPVATLDVDVFLAFRPEPGQLIPSPKAIFDYLTVRGCSMKDEHVMIAGGPVQFADEGPLDPVRFQEIVRRHDLVDAWAKFERQFLTDTR